MLRRLQPLAAAIAMAVVLGGCATEKPAADTATPSTPNTLGDAYREINAVAKDKAGMQPALGRGDSMAPIVGDDTLVLINPIRYEDLRLGMAVAYRNNRGQRVVHFLVEKTREGWIVAGFANDRIDNELVTPQNLLGVVYATFYPTGEPAAATEKK